MCDTPVGALLASPAGMRSMNKGLGVPQPNKPPMLTELASPGVILVAEAH